MRAIWTGAIGFGLVNIPVRMMTAVHDSRLDLDMLDKRDEGKIRYVRINEDTGKEVEWGDIVKGYKYNNKYVVLTEDDFEQVSPKKSQMVEIENFIPAEDIDTRYYESPYYLEPAKGGEKAYGLLREALKKSGKVAIGSFIMRSREHLCLLQGFEDVILLIRIRFAEEIRSYDELSLPAKSGVTAAELKMALSLIDHLSPKKFDIKKYKDRFDSDLLKIIKAKAKGKHVEEPKFKIVYSKKKDLMSQLKASLEGRRKAS